MLSIESRDVLLVVGTRGYGKTTYVQENVITKDSCVWDPHDEYEHGGKAVSIDRLLKYPRSLKGLRVKATSMWPHDISRDFKHFVRFMESYKRAWFPDILAVDECFLLRESASDAMAFLATQSRHWGERGTALCLIAQRAVHVHPTAREQSNRVVSFSQDAGKDIEALREKMGDLAESIPSLTVGQYVYWSRVGVKGPANNVYGP